MKIFLSWSGDRSKELALCFKNWLPNVLQNIDPYMSSKDIALGERWSNNIEDNLREHDFGLVFITPENIDAPWINFEAGALSKNLKSRLIPMIYNADVTILNTGPLKQFQSQKSFDEESILDLLKSMNDKNIEEKRITTERLELAFQKWWPDLQEMLDNIPDILDNNEKGQENGDFDKQALISIMNKLDNIEKNNRPSRRPRTINQKAVYDLKQSYEGILKTNSMMMDALQAVEDDAEFNIGDILMEDLEKQTRDILLLEKVVSYFDRLQ